MIQSIFQLGEGLPGLVQTTIQSRQAGNMFKNMSDMDVVKTQILLDKKFRDRYNDIGQYDTAAMYGRRAEALENLLRIANENVPVNEANNGRSQEDYRIEKTED